MEETKSDPAILTVAKAGKVGLCQNERTKPSRCRAKGNAHQSRPSVEKCCSSRDHLEFKILLYDIFLISPV